MLQHANGECCDGEIYRCDREPWSLLPEDAEIAMGLSHDEHEEHCQVYRTASWPVNYECDCERREFSWWSCDGCGSQLGGTRHAFALWESAN